MQLEEEVILIIRKAKVKSGRVHKSETGLLAWEAGR